LLTRAGKPFICSSPKRLVLRQVNEPISRRKRSDSWRCFFRTLGIRRSPGFTHMTPISFPFHFDHLRPTKTTGWINLKELPKSWSRKGCYGIGKVNVWETEGRRGTDIRKRRRSRNRKQDGAGLSGMFFSFIVTSSGYFCFTIRCVGTLA
jgi:hypothetical protein